MAPDQRIFTIPSFYTEFEPTCNQIAILNEKYKNDYLPWLTAYQQIKRQWICELSRLNKCYDAGVKVDPGSFCIADDEFESFTNQKGHFDRLAYQIECKIIDHLQHIKVMWKDVEDDLKNGFLDRTKYFEYVKMVRILVRNGNGLACYHITFLED
jgi:hypothetical protein